MSEKRCFRGELDGEKVLKAFRAGYETQKIADELAVPEAEIYNVLHMQRERELVERYGRV